MFMIRLMLLPFRIAAGLTLFGVRAGYRSGRVLGYRRLVFFAAGVGVGLLVAPMTGREARAKLQAYLESRRPGAVPDPELGERVRVELRHATRTWHLPQPKVDVLAGRVLLSGTVPHETARADIERTAAGVPGVVAVENNLLVAGTNGQP
jgi:hypothetical protein